MKSQITIAAAALALALAPLAAMAAGDADNTGRNAVDRNEATVTPGDQGNSDSDVAITREIRKKVVDQDGLSTNAKNVKIVTNEGVVTLRGPVADASEKATIGSIASQAAGVKRVDDQLEVEKK